MSRGLPPKKALEAALLLARLRGQVIMFRQDAEAPGDFMIIGPEGIIVVRVRRTRHLRVTLKAVEFQQQEALALLHSADLVPEILRELWLWCPFGSMRFFRLEDQGLVELDRHGEDILRFGRKTVSQNCTGRGAGETVHPKSPYGDLTSAPSETPSSPG
ncbi:MAG: hypothetical protein LUQ66_07740 [Methanoregula sp.]|nr:hypothetical protein [Methanoregula sp.]